MSDGTSFLRFKAALVTALQARTRLTNVNYESPVQPADMVGADGSGEGIWFADDATWNFDIPVFVGEPLWYDEEFQVTLVIQAVGKTTDDDQQAVDTKVVAMLGEVIAVLASDPMVLLPNDNEIQVRHALVTGAKWVGGNVDASVNAARIELDIAVTARLKLST